MHKTIVVIGGNPLFFTKIHERGKSCQSYRRFQVLEFGVVESSAMSTENGSAGRTRRGRKAPSIQHPSSTDSKTRNAECGAPGPGGLPSSRPTGRGNGPLGDRALPYALGIQYHWNQISERSEWRPMRGKMIMRRNCKMLAFTTLGMEVPGFWRLPSRQNVRLLFAFCSLNFHFLFFVKCFGTGNRWEGGRLKL